jgi:hypothetical protein
MGSAYWIIALIIIAGCLKSSEPIVLKDACCYRIVNGECRNITNSSNNVPIPDLTINNGGRCSEMSRLCRGVNITYKGNNTIGNIPFCRYANVDMCNFSFTALTYGKLQTKGTVDYDYLVQMFMFNNTTTQPVSEYIGSKTPKKLLYATIQPKFVGYYDLDKFNIYGMKFGVGDSIEEYEHYKYYFPFDLSYDGQSGFNPFFYALSNKSDGCRPSLNGYRCEDREFPTMETCLLFCERPDNSWAIRSFGNDLVNKSIGFERVESYDGFSRSEIQSNERLFRTFMMASGLENLVKRYSVGMYRIFSSGNYTAYPNFNTTVNISNATLSESGGLYIGIGFECGLGLGLGFKNENKYTLNEGIYEMEVSNGSRNYSFNSTTNITKTSYNISFLIKNLNITKFTKNCFGLIISFCSCRTEEIISNFTHNASYYELFQLQKAPLYKLKDIVLQYYERYGYLDNHIHKLTQKYYVQNNTFINTSSLPFECLSGDLQTQNCDVEYYRRYTCIDKETGADIECGCDEFNCYVFEDTNESLRKRGPTLKINGELQSSRTVEILYPDYYFNGYRYENPDQLPKRLIKYQDKNAIAFALVYSNNGYRKVQNCFENYTGSDQILTCEDKNCGVDQDYINKTFTRYYIPNITDNATIYLRIIVDNDGDGNYGRCKGKNVNVTLDGKNYLDLDIRVYGVSLPSYRRLTSLVINISEFYPDLEYSGSPEDDLSMAKYSCYDDNMNYGDNRSFFGNTQQIDLSRPSASIVYDKYRRLIGCYKGIVVLNRSFDTLKPITIQRDYRYGLYKHLPNTVKLKDYMAQGVQPIIFLNSSIPKDYLYKILHDIDGLLMIDGPIPRPFIKYSSYPIGAAIVVVDNPNNIDQVKRICPTCLVTYAKDMYLSGNSVGYYDSLGGDLCNRTSQGIDICINSTISCDNRDILFYIVRGGLTTIDPLITTLDLLNRKYGKPIYLYLDGENIDLNVLTLLSNHSEKLAGAGVMGIHVGKVNQLLGKPGRYYYSLSELSRSIGSSTQKTPIPVLVNRSECSKIIEDSGTRYTISCIEDPIPRVGSIPNPTIKIVNYTTFPSLAYEIGLANQYGKSICVKLGDNNYLTYKILNVHIKGTNPVVYSELDDRTIDFVKYTYRDDTYKQCILLD